MTDELKIEKIKRKSSRSPWYVIDFSDGGEPVLLHQDVYYDAHWFEGMTIEASAVEEVINRQDRTMCRKSAWRLIAKRPRSRFEMARSLNRRFPKKTVGGILDDLEEKGHLSDRVYSELLIRELMNKGSGVQQVRQKAMQKGIAKPLIEEMMEKHLDTDQQEDTAKRLLEKWCERKKVFKSTAHRKQAAAQFLARKGYQADLVWNLVGELSDTEEDF